MVPTGDIDVRPDTMEGLATTLQLGMISLDGLAQTAPLLPDAGRSSGVIADSIGAVSAAMAALTGAFGGAASNIEATVATNSAAEDATTSEFDVGME